MSGPNDSAAPITDEQRSADVKTIKEVAQALATPARTDTTDERAMNEARLDRLIKDDPKAGEQALKELQTVLKDKPGAYQKDDVPIINKEIAAIQSRVEENKDAAKIEQLAEAAASGKGSDKSLLDYVKNHGDRAAEDAIAKLQAESQSTQPTSKWDMVDMSPRAMATAESTKERASPETTIQQEEIQKIRDAMAKKGVSYGGEQGRTPDVQHSLPQEKGIAEPQRGGTPA